MTTENNQQNNTQPPATPAPAKAPAPAAPAKTAPLAKDEGQNAAVKSSAGSDKVELPKDGGEDFHQKELRANNLSQSKEIEGEGEFSSAAGVGDLHAREDAAAIARFEDMKTNPDKWLAKNAKAAKDTEGSSSK